MTIRYTEMYEWEYISIILWAVLVIIIVTRGSSNTTITKANTHNTTEVRSREDVEYLTENMNKACYTMSTYLLSENIITEDQYNEIIKKHIVVFNKKMLNNKFKFLLNKESVLYYITVATIEEKVND